MAGEGEVGSESVGNISIFPLRKNNAFKRFVEKRNFHVWN